MDNPSHWGIGKSREPSLRFKLGHIKWSSAALKFLATVCGEQAPKEYGTKYVMKHVQGEWGDAPWADNNEAAIKNGDGLVITTFPIGDEKLIVLTVFQEGITIVMTPEDTRDTDKRPDGMLDVHIDTDTEDD